MRSTNHIGGSEAQKTPTGEVLATHRTFKKDSGYQTQSGDFKIFEREDSKLLIPYEEVMKTLETYKSTSSTPHETKVSKLPWENIRLLMENAKILLIETEEQN